MNTYKHICPNTFIANARFYIFSMLACATLFFSSCSENSSPVNSELTMEKKVEDNTKQEFITEDQLNEFLYAVNSKSNTRQDYSLRYDDLENYIETALNYSYGDMRKRSKKTKLVKGSIPLDYKTKYSAGELRDLYSRTLSTLRGHKRDVPFKVDFVNYIDIEVDQEAAGYVLNYAIRMGEKESQERTPSRWVFTIPELDAYNRDCDGNVVPGYDKTPVEIADRATYNVNIPWATGPCCYYTVNIETDGFRSHQPDSYGFVNMWDITCSDGDCFCGDWALCDCPEYYHPWDIDNGLQLNSNGIAHWCLTTSELNQELLYAETAGENWADEVNKEIIGFSIDLDFIPCGSNTNKHYYIEPTRAHRGIIFNSNQGPF